MEKSCAFITDTGNRCAGCKLGWWRDVTLDLHSGTYCKCCVPAVQFEQRSSIMLSSCVRSSLSWCDEPSSCCESSKHSCWCFEDLPPDAKLGVGVCADSIGQASNTTAQPLLHLLSPVPLLPSRVYSQTCCAHWGASELCLKECSSSISPQAEGCADVDCKRLEDT
jgi:hypothetical protein